MRKSLKLGLLVAVGALVGWWFAQAQPDQPAPPAATTKYMLQDHEIVECSEHYILNCGVVLDKCTDGIVYECLTNVGVYK